MHQHSLGATVQFQNDLPYRSQLETYEIVAQLPANEFGEAQYRIKKLGEPGQRVARESQLAVTVDVKALGPGPLEATERPDMVARQGPARARPQDI